MTPQHETAVRDHFSLLWRYFRSRADADAEDLVQQTLVEYLESAGRAGPVRHPRAYVLRVARSVLFRHYRARGPFDPMTQSVVDATLGPSSRLARHRREGRLQAALEELPYALHEVVDLYYGEGMRGAELADALGVPEGTVRSRLRRAKDQLRTACAAVG